MHNEVDLIRACLRLARSARQVGPPTVAGAAAQWEMRFEERLVQLGAEPPKPRFRGRPKRGPVSAPLAGLPAPDFGVAKTSVPAEVA